MLHTTLSSYSKFLSTPNKREMFVRKATKTYELAPIINKAESFSQMMKDVPGSVVLDIYQSLRPSWLKIKQFQVFLCISQQWPWQCKWGRHPLWVTSKETDTKARREALGGLCCSAVTLQWHFTTLHCFLPGLFQQPPNWSLVAGPTHLHPLYHGQCDLSPSFSDQRASSVIWQWLPHSPMSPMCCSQTSIDWLTSPCLLCTVLLMHPSVRSCHLQAMPSAADVRYSPRPPFICSCFFLLFLCLVHSASSWIHLDVISSETLPKYFWIACVSSSAPCNPCHSLFGASGRPTLGAPFALDTTTVGPRSCTNGGTEPLHLSHSLAPLSPTPTPPPPQQTYLELWPQLLFRASLPCPWVLRPSSGSAHLFEPVYFIKLTSFADLMHWELKVFITLLVLKVNFTWVSITDFHWGQGQEAPQFPKLHPGQSPRPRFSNQNSAT